MECEVMSKTYEQMLVVPAAATVIGEVELYAHTHGFYISAFTAAMLALAESATLITAAESVKVTKAGGSAWVAGEWIYWDEASSNFTNIPASDRFCVGKAQKIALNADVIGFVIFQDNYHPIQLGTTAVPILFTAAGQKVFDAHVSSSLVGANVEPFTLETIMTGVGGVGGRAKFTLSTEVALGGWANALKAVLELGATGGVAGLGSAFCAELVMNTGGALPGTQAALELEINAAGAFNPGTCITGAIFLGVAGAEVVEAGNEAYFLVYNGPVEGSGQIFDTDSTGDTPTGGLRCLVNGVVRYLSYI